MRKYIQLTVSIFYLAFLLNSCTKTPDACIDDNTDNVYYSGDTIAFKSCSIDGATYFWEFGDGQTSNETHPKHVFFIPRDYSVKLTVTSDNGKKSSSDSKTIKINFPTQIIINKIVLTQFPESFIDPNIFMIFSVDSNLISANNQIFNNCKQGMEYTFDQGFPYTINGENGDFGTVHFEFRDFRGPSNNPQIGFQKIDLVNLFYANIGDFLKYVKVASTTGIEFEIHYEIRP